MQRLTMLTLKTEMAMADRNRKDSEKISEILNDLSPATCCDLESFYRILYQILGRIFNLSRFYIALGETKTGKIHIPFYRDGKSHGPGEGVRSNWDHALLEQVISQETPLLLSRNEIQKSLGKKAGEGIGSWMGVPMVGLGGAIVVIDGRSDYLFDGRDLDFLLSMARHAARFIECRQAKESHGDAPCFMGNILESFPMGIAFIHGRRFKWVNREMGRLFGYPGEGELLGRDVRMIHLSDTAYEFVGKSMYEALARRGVSDCEIELLKKDGSTFPAHVRLSRPRGKNGGEIVVVTDISKRRAAEKESQERERLQGVLEMAGAVCHEINQPLQTLMGHAELLLMGGEDEEGTQARLTSIKEQAGRIAAITQKLSNITQYKTLEYPGATRIVDIWGAGEPGEKM